MDKYKTGTVICRYPYWRLGKLPDHTEAAEQPNLIAFVIAEAATIGACNFRSGGTAIVDTKSPANSTRSTCSALKRFTARPMLTTWS